MMAMPKIAGEGFYTCNIRVEYEWKPPRLILDGKVTFLDDEGKPLEKVNSLGDYDSEDEVALVDNEMASFWLLRWMAIVLIVCQEVLEKFQSICNNLDIKVRGRKKK
ncbi:hypothetical protein Tco_1121246 [Tanacetum coccineum]|uniref:Uncharacterized protein n=1 Tax=Tanacetum coccineum TaxID=301880 RepID=A0ABQ5IXJ5_9ASTR